MRRRAALLVLALMAVGLLAAGPVSAHADLVRSVPGDGDRLSRPPRVVVLEFTEAVDLVEGGLVLTNAGGSVVRTPAPATRGRQVRWPMPASLADGAYTVRWRVLSDDGHPVAGTFSFGVRAEAGPPEAAVAQPGPTWPVAAARFAGYLGFAAVAGVVVFAWVCWTPGRRDAGLVALLRAGLALSVLATVAGLLLEGQYAAGAPATRVFSASLLDQTVHTPFGEWTLLRLYVYLAMSATLAFASSLDSRVNRAAAAVELLVASFTFSGTAHAVASGRLTDRLVDSVHVLAAGVWVGGLLAVVSLGLRRADRPPPEAFARFSRVAMTAVLVVVGTGTVNAVIRLDAFGDLWRSGYGRLLTTKLALVVATLVVASVSRRRVRAGEAPWHSVRVEAALVVLVLVVTSVLTLTAPAQARPPDRVSPAATRPTDAAQPGFFP